MSQNINVTDFNITVLAIEFKPKQNWYMIETKAGLRIPVQANSLLEAVLSVSNEVYFRDITNSIPIIDPNKQMFSLNDMLNMMK